MSEICLPRREREKLRQRREILTTALALFAERGYHNVSMHEIAEKAEFAIGTVYKFFQNKEELYKALVLLHCDEFEEAFLEVIEGPEDEVEKLRNYIRTRSERFLKNLSFVRLFLAESRGVSFNMKAGLNEELRRRYYNFMQKLAVVIEEGMRKGRFKRIADSFHLAVALDNVADAFLLLWIESPELYPYPEDPDAILDIFFKGLVEP